MSYNQHYSRRNHLVGISKHTNQGAIGHRLVVEYTDEERDGRDDHAMIEAAEKDAIRHCRASDKYPALPKDDPRRLIAQGMRAKPDEDGVVRRFTVWVRPLSRRAPSPWGGES